MNLDHLKAVSQTVFSAAQKTVVQVSKAVANEVVHGVVGAQCLLEYNVEKEHVASVNKIWKIYFARSKKEGIVPYPVVSVWVLDKRSITSDTLGLSKNSKSSFHRLEALLERCRKDVQHLSRLKHPSIIRLVSPVEETRTQLVFITEPIFASLDDILHGGGHLPPELEKELKSIVLPPLEIKMGLLQIAEGLRFLHNDAGLVHCGISPSSILLTKNGDWKLASFSFAVPLQTTMQRDDKPPIFDYSNIDITAIGMALQPSMGYSSPEIVIPRVVSSSISDGSASPLDPGPIKPSSDIFSLGVVSYELFANRRLLPTSCSFYDYEERIIALQRSRQVEDGVPSSLATTLRPMVSLSPPARPGISWFSNASFFTDDDDVRMLRFLETSLQRSLEERASFLRHELPRSLQRWPDRVLLYRVLPPLLQELRTKELQASALPLVLLVLKRQSPEDFHDITLPALKPLLESATRDTLLQLVTNAPLFLNVARNGVMVDVVPKLLVRAITSDDPRCQEESLNQVSSLAETLEHEALTRAILPVVHTACLSTTTASIRVASFKAMAACARRVDRSEADAMLEIAAQVAAVDTSAATAMCILGLGETLAKKWGVKLAATKVLPSLCPLLASPSLSQTQFATCLKSVKEIIDVIEKSRGESGNSGSSGAGGTLGSSGSKIGSSGANTLTNINSGGHSHDLQKATMSIDKADFTDYMQGVNAKTATVIGSPQVPSEAYSGGGAASSPMILGASSTGKSIRISGNTLHKTADASSTSKTIINSASRKERDSAHALWEKRTTSSNGNTRPVRKGTLAQQQQRHQQQQSSDPFSLLPPQSSVPALTVHSGTKNSVGMAPSGNDPFSDLVSRPAAIQKKSTASTLNGSADVFDDLIMQHAAAMPRKNGNIASGSSSLI